jgi:hypothetical protein
LDPEQKEAEPAKKMAKWQGGKRRSFLMHVKQHEPIKSVTQGGPRTMLGAASPEMVRTRRRLALTPNRIPSKALMDPMVGTAPCAKAVGTLDSKVVASPGPAGRAISWGLPQKQSRIQVLCRKQPRIEVLRPALLDELATKAPTILEGQNPGKVLANNPILARNQDSSYQDVDKRFDPAHCQIATSDEVAPFASRVCVKGDPHGTNLHCEPIDLCLLRDLNHCNLKHRNNDQGLLPSIGKICASLEVPMVISYVTDDVAILRPGHVFFSK